MGTTISKGEVRQQVKAAETQLKADPVDASAFDQLARAKPEEAAKWLGKHFDKDPVKKAALEKLKEDIKREGKKPTPEIVSRLEALFQGRTDPKWTQKANGSVPTDAAAAIARRAAAADAATAAKEAFAAKRTPENFRAWANESPAQAGLWLSKVADTIGDSAASANALKLAGGRDDKAARATQLGTMFDDLKATKLPAYESKSGPDVPSKQLDPPALTGTVESKSNQRWLTTQPGGERFKLASPPSFESSSQLGGTDAESFADPKGLVTVRGWPSKDDPHTLAVEEFAPGGSPTFFSGRVRGDYNGAPDPNAPVMVRVRPDKEVKIEDHDLAAAFRKYPRLGVVLPGAVQKRGSEYVYGDKPRDYYVLGGFSVAHDAKQVGDNMEFSLQLGHGQTGKCVMPKSVWDSSERGQRHYLYGHFKDGVFYASAVGKKANNDFPQGPSTQPSVDFVMNAIPVTEPKYAASDAAFDRLARAQQ